MPDKLELEVTITTNKPQDPLTCKPDREFVAKRGSTVVFKFPEFPKADIIFKNGPFDKDDLTPGPHKVKADAAETKFKYDIKWPGGGVGGGTGVVIGG